LPSEKFKEAAKIRFVYTNINNMPEEKKANAEVELAKTHAEMIKTLKGRINFTMSEAPCFFRREKEGTSRVS
jgi:hypothetical protein